MKLMICEKRDQAEKVAGAIGLRQGKGCYEGKFQGDHLILVWARGHLLTLKTPDEVKPDISWQDPTTLVPIPRKYEQCVSPDLPKAPAAAQPKRYIQNIGQFFKKGPSEVIIGTDADREGEAIGWEIISHFNYTGSVKRAWLAAGLDKKSITDAMSNLRPPEKTKGWWRASQARARSDWGFMFLVRAYTYYAGYSCFGPNLGGGSGRSGVMSVGRVQSPSVALIVAREHAIKNFKPTDHFQVIGDFSDQPGNKFLASYKPLVTQEVIDRQPPGVTWEPSKKIPKEGEPDPLDDPLFTGKNEVDAFGSRLMAAKDSGVINSYKEGTRKESPPKTYSLTDAQADIGAKLGIDSNLVQTILEDLYEQGYLSYARTSKADLPLNFYQPDELRSILGAVSGINEVASQSQVALDIHSGRHPTIKKFTPSVFTKKDLEHHGIIPTHEKMTSDRLNTLKPSKKSSNNRIMHNTDMMGKAYLMVVKRFIQALYPPALYATQEAEISIPVVDLLGHQSSRFITRGERLTDSGWQAAFKNKASKDTSIPVLSKNSKALLTDISLDKKTTTPPKRYTTVTLPKAMEKISNEVTEPKLRKLLRDSEGIGTPATRKAIIETLEARNYIEIKKQAIYATAKAIDLVSQVEKWLVSPQETALWEDFLIKICNEQDDNKAQQMRDAFVTKITDRIEELINKLRETYSGNLGPKISSGGRVTPKMKAAIKSIAEKKGIKLERGTLLDGDKARAFLDEHAGGSREPGEISDAQKKFAQNIIDNLPTDKPAPDNVFENNQTCSKFINDFKGYLPPTEGMIKFAKSLAEKLPDDKKPSEDVFKYSGACKKFLDQNSGGGKSAGNKAKRKSPAKARR